MNGVKTPLTIPLIALYSFKILRLELDQERSKFHKQTNKSKCPANGVGFSDLVCRHSTAS